MPEELSDTLKIGRLEDKFGLYEPMLRSLHGITSIPAEITKIQGDLQVLRESRAAVKEQLNTLFRSQDKVYRDMVKSLEGQTKLLEKEIAECPIDNMDSRLLIVERDILIVGQFDARLETIEKAIDSFKLKGWDLIFRIAPWIIAFATTVYAMINN